MNEPRSEGQTIDFNQKAEQIKQQAADMQGKVAESLNKAMTTTAENLEKTADKIQQTAEFFRQKNADTLKDDMANLVQKYPAQTLAGALIFGFLFGKIISK